MAPRRNRTEYRQTNYTIETGFNSTFETITLQLISRPDDIFETTTFVLASSISNGEQVRRVTDVNERWRGIMESLTVAGSASLIFNLSEFQLVNNKTLKLVVSKILWAMWRYHWLFIIERVPFQHDLILNKIFEKQFYFPFYFKIAISKTRHLS